MDFESLSEFLEQATQERERLKDGSKVGASSGGLKSFFKDKYDEMKGADPERIRQDKLGKLEQKIVEVRVRYFQSFRPIYNFIQKNNAEK
jgi:sorting nexin-4